MKGNIPQMGEIKNTETEERYTQETFLPENTSYQAQTRNTVKIRGESSVVSSDHLQLLKADERNYIKI